MLRITNALTWISVVGLALAACGPTPTAAPTAPSSRPALPNPASEFCEANSGVLEIRTGTDGAQTGVCTFPDGSECDEWAYFRGECQPGTTQVSAGPSPSSSQVVAPEPIALQVLLPEDGSQIDIPQCQVIGTTSPGAVVTVNDEIIIAGADGTFQTTVTLEPGANLIEVVASNSAGSEAFVQLVVTYGS